MTTIRRRVATVAAVVLLPLGAWQAASFAATSGNGQGNNGAGNGNGGSTSTTPAKALVASFASATPIAPGLSGVVKVSVKNPNSQAVKLTSLSGTVTGIGAGTRPNLQPCDKSWIVLQPWSGSELLPANATTTMQMTVSFDNKAAINQDNCRGVTYQFSFVVNGQQA
jgi:hypothetical protein